MSSLQELPLPLIVGLAVGSFYALIALCFHLVFASASAVNFAQGQFFMYGALIYASISAGHLPVVAAIVLCAGILMVGSAIFAILIFQPLNREGVPHLALVLVPVAAGSALDALALRIWGSAGENAPALFPNKPIRIGAATIVPQDLAIIGATWIIVLVLWLILEKTYLGISIRAVAANQQAARMQGINVGLCIMIVFGLTGLVSGIGGSLIAPLTGATVTIGDIWSILGVLAAVLGGLTTAVGAVIGGVLLGVAQELATFYISSNYSQAITLGLLIVLLIIRPNGLLTSARSSRV